MRRKDKGNVFENIPVCVAEFIRLIIKKMGYRRKVREDVRAELVAHFEDALKDCASDEERQRRAEKLIAQFGDAKLLGVLARRAKKRCRPLWRTAVVRTFQATGVIIVCLVVYVVWFFMGKPNITVDYVAELNRLVQPTANKQQNAAPYYDRARELFVAFDEQAGRIPRAYEVSWKDIGIDTREAIEKNLADNMASLEQLVLGSRKPHYWQRYHSERGELLAVLVPGLREIRDLCRALCWRASVNVEQGQLKKGIDDLAACYRVGRHFKGKKFIVEQFVGITGQNTALWTAASLLSEHQLDLETLAKLQSEFEGLISDEDFIINLELEKLAMYDEIQRCFTGGRLGGLHGGGLYLKGLQRLMGLAGSDVLDKLFEQKALLTPLHVLFTHPNKQKTRQMGEKYYSYLQDLAQKTPAQLRAENIDFTARFDEFTKGNLFLKVFAPALTRAMVISYQNKAEAQALVTIVAFLRYVKDKGNFPEDLGELVTAGYLKNLPMDPYSDGPLRYQRRGGDFVLYSLGADFDDDGGMPSKWGKGDHGGDQVFWPVGETE